LSQLPSAEKKKINQQSKMTVNQTLQENRIVENHLLPLNPQKKNHLLPQSCVAQRGETPVANIIR
jgi:hypothetical protein